MGSHCPPRARGRASCRAGLGTGTAEGGSPAASTLLPAPPSPAPPRSGPRPAPGPAPPPRPALGRLRPRVWPPRAQCRGHFQRPLAAQQPAAHRQPSSGAAASRETPRTVSRSRSCGEPSFPTPSGSARTDQDCLRPREATLADARPPGRSEPRRPPVSECVTQAASPPVSLSHPQPEFPPARAGVGLGRLKGCEDNLGHPLKLMSRGPNGTCSNPGGDRIAELCHPRRLL